MSELFSIMVCFDVLQASLKTGDSLSCFVFSTVSSSKSIIEFRLSNGIVVGLLSVSASKGSVLGREDSKAIVDVHNFSFGNLSCAFAGVNSSAKFFELGVKNGVFAFLK